jgi:uncharacterized membrane protein YjjP (DUF1212 family)
LNTETHSLNEILDCALLVSQIFLENNAETYRAEEGAARVCKSFGIDNVQTFALPTTIIATVSNPGGPPVTALRRVQRRAINLSVIDRANDLCRKAENRELTFKQAMDGFTALLQPDTLFDWKAMLYAAAASGFFALFYGSDVYGFVIAFICGLCVQAIKGALSREHSAPFLVSLLGSVALSLITSASAMIIPSLNVDATIAGALMPLVPGLALTNSIRDVMHGDLLSGVARAAEVVLVAASLAVGVGVVLGMYSIIEKVL